MAAKTRSKSLKAGFILRVLFAPAPDESIGAEHPRFSCRPPGPAVLKLKSNDQPMLRPESFCMSANRKGNGTFKSAGTTLSSPSRP